MLVDTKGRPFYQTSIAKLIIYVSMDDGSTWNPVKNDDVPDWVKDPDVLGQMIDGNVCCCPTKEMMSWYRAERLH